LGSAKASKGEEMQDIVVDPEEDTVGNTVDEEESANLESSVEEELQETQEQEENFRGMDYEALQRSYTELERRMSQQGQELGELRKYADTLIKRPAPEVEETDFFEDPAKAVSSAIEGNDRIRTLEERQQQIELATARSELMRRHPDYQKIDESPEFAKFINSSKVRQRAYLEASRNMDVEIADELMSQYKETIQNQSVQSEKLDSERKETLKAVKSDSGSPGGTATKKIFRRADLLKLQITDPNRYDEMQDEIMLAYQEGRVR
jgi:hypothetical protein